jgi:hypothetical protein
MDLGVVLGWAVYEFDHVDEPRSVTAQGRSSTVFLTGSDS